LEYPGIHRRTIIKWEVVDCIHPAKDRSKWESLVNEVINLQVL
jgi:hypothetical protein